jgi:hypothetical protein
VEKKKIAQKMTKQQDSVAEFLKVSREKFAGYQKKVLSEAKLL